MSRRLLAAPLVACLLLVACGGSGEDESATPTVQETARLCQDIDEAGESLTQVRQQALLALIPGNEATFQDTIRRARAEIDDLDSSAREMEGGSDQVAELREDIQEFQRLLATPDIRTVIPQIQLQADAIAADLQELRATAGCR